MVIFCGRAAALPAIPPVHSAIFHFGSSVSVSAFVSEQLPVPPGQKDSSRAAFRFCCCLLLFSWAFFYILLDVLVGRHPHICPSTRCCCCCGGRGERGPTTEGRGRWPRGAWRASDYTNGTHTPMHFEVLIFFCTIFQRFFAVVLITHDDDFNY